MPSNKLYRKYSPEDMGRAIAAVKSRKYVAFSSKQFNVPRVTLLYKIQRKYEVNCRIGPPTILIQTEEQHLVHWLLNISDAGFPGTRSQLFDSVHILVKQLNRPNSFKNGRPGRKWFSSTFSTNRGNEIRSYIDSKNLSDIFDNPRRIYNADETTFFLAPKEIKSLMGKGDDKNAYNFTSNDDEECLTCLITANAAGAILSPSLMPKEWTIGKSDSGWMTSQSFYEFVANIFHPCSHLTMKLGEFNNQIELVALYPNATHILQPLDVAVFHPPKNCWKKGVQRYKMKNDRAKIKTENFSPLLATVLDQSIKSETIGEGFKICGLCPLDENTIPYKKYFKSEHNKDKETSLETGDSWQGDVNDTSLFHLWKKVHNEINLHKEDNLSDSLSEPVNQADEYINVQNEINHNLDETQSSDTDVRIKSTDKIIAEQSTSPVTPGPSNKVVVVQDIVVKPAKSRPKKILALQFPHLSNRLCSGLDKLLQKRSCSSSIDMLFESEEDDWDMKQDFDEDSGSDTTNDSDVERPKRKTNTGIIKALDYAGVSLRYFVILQFVYNKDTKIEFLKEFVAQMENISDDKIQLKCMRNYRESRNVFAFPDVTDVCYVSKISDVGNTRFRNEPVITNIIENPYTVSREEKEAITEDQAPTKSTEGVENQKPQEKITSSAISEDDKQLVLRIKMVPLKRRPYSRKLRRNKKSLSKQKQMQEKKEKEIVDTVRGILDTIAESIVHDDNAEETENINPEAEEQDKTGQNPYYLKRNTNSTYPIYL
ncbi:hypothetical protein ILUMI_13226 [Ignelater luminosus]|uniref:DDE-1 domain-containing protein n=1 Tax=Ignelater luminosus TaxID=2038154 RepID=A0A8K0G8V0_IGNLU|nr:hypothetical protein ILUMI_13226 [Ignelater luminosus]